MKPQTDIAAAFSDIAKWPKNELAQFLRHLPILAEVMAERERQDKKHGVQIRPPFEYSIILNEEVGELNKEVCENYFSGIEFSGNMRAELVQVAGVALAALFSYDVRQARENWGYSAGYPTPEEKKRVAAWGSETCPLTPGPLTGYAISAAESTSRAERDQPNTFCVTPAVGCTDTMCDNNGCANRVRVPAGGPTEGASAGNSIGRAVEDLAGVSTGRPRRRGAYCSEIGRACPAQECFLDGCIMTTPDPTTGPNNPHSKQPE